jgi:hypothetical protein
LCSIFPHSKSQFCHWFACKGFQTLNWFCGTLGIGNLSQKEIYVRDLFLSLSFATIMIFLSNYPT